jgi:predicted ATP-grasp superfamily ATP-dependent carboligase
MNILVSSSRMPFVLDEIRKFGRAGHRVFAADTFYAAPGSHSRHVARHFEVTAPEEDALGFVDDIDAIARACAIDVIVPGFEDVFYLARHRRRLSVRLLAPDFELLARLHHKARFRALAEELGLPTPETLLVESSDELRAAITQIPRFLARPAYSRGGTHIFTNAGPLDGELALEDCHPTPAQPWLVQEYIDGTDVCGFSVAREGRILAHCTYLHPREIEHAGGIAFESIEDGEVLICAQRIVGATGYDGQISIDYRRGPRGLVLLECNPRPSAGVHLMSPAMLVDALFGAPDGRVAVVPPGVRRIYTSALVRDAIVHPRELLRDLGYLLSGASDIYAERGDRLPALFQILSYGYVLSYRLRHHERLRHAATLIAAYFDGISWNGERL